MRSLTIATRFSENEILLLSEIQTYRGCKRYLASNITPETGR